ncbi:unnamed protein product [Acanthoscelides obtectus]|uniref:Cysteine/serine-rich nuclear protein N-terminal domain-containing protein n=1 Tax=Acanthoscelides obtectus TaxID=200917 RepID=A0A9P0MGE0_ACAOB|nr:unnamed protein product [Acanthoscelides obtectus]CAK1677303.1 Cysteine/serine-rich nuclear protein 3 [Acanthoscelides obtectus]
MKDDTKIIPDDSNAAIAPISHGAASYKEAITNSDINIVGKSKEGFVENEPNEAVVEDQDGMKEKHKDDENVHVDSITRNDVAVKDKLNGEMVDGESERGADGDEGNDNIDVEEEITGSSVTVVNELKAEELSGRLEERKVEDSEIVDGEDSATESLPPTEELVEEPHDRSDGSDSGLGSELCEERPQGVAANGVESDGESSLLCKINEEAQFDELQTTVVNCSENPTRSDDVDSAVVSEIGKQDLLSEEQSKLSRIERQPAKSSLKRSNPDSDESEEPKAKKRRGISFDSVTVFYFPRAQGFTCVPSQGGSTLGMGAQHTHVKKFSLAEHAVEQRRLHRQLLQQIR